MAENIHPSEYADVVKRWAQEIDWLDTDVSPKFARTEDGCWVRAWVYVDDDEVASQGSADSDDTD